MGKKKIIFDVVGALIKRDNKFLLCQRLADDLFGLLWEFPGGKVETGEDKKSALKREMKEELGIEVKVGKLINTFTDEIPTMKIIVYLYNCWQIRGRARCLECQALKWVSLKEIGALNLAPADRKIYTYLAKNLSR